MKNILIIFVCLVYYTCSAQKANPKISENNFNFKVLFQNFKLRSQLKIVKTKKQDYFKGNLSGCNKSFYKGVIKSEMYHLQSNKNDIVVEEYIYKDQTSSKNAFQGILKYADITRNLKRKDYGKRCYQVPDEQIYYAVNKGIHTYLITTISEVSFKDEDTSIDNVFKNNKEILIDDLYNKLIR